MAAGDLLFESSPSQDLVFGALAAAVVPQPLGLAVTLPAPIANCPLQGGAIPLGLDHVPAISGLHLTSIQRLGLDLTLPAPAALFLLQAATVQVLGLDHVPVVAGLHMSYDNAVNRAPFRWAASAFQVGVTRGKGCRARHGSTGQRHVDALATMATASPRRPAMATLWQALQRTRRPLLSIPFSAGTDLTPWLAEAYSQLSTQRRPALLVPYTEANPLPLIIGSAWHEMQRRPRPSMSIPWGLGLKRSLIVVAPSGVGRPSRLQVRIPWQSGRYPLHGVRVPVDPPGGPTLYVPSPHLLFDDAYPASVHLVFGRPGRPAVIRAHIIIPIRRSYIVVNDVTLVRVSNNLALPTITLSLSIDADSWCWGWEASLPATALDDVLPAGPGAPVELSATVNGVNFLLLAERITRDRRFAQARITVSGRGIAAELGDPYSPLVSRSNLAELTAQQIMAEALTENGVGIGWSLDWQLTDWLVPAGVWSHTGSHIEAVTRIAEAAGAYVVSERKFQKPCHARL